MDFKPEEISVVKSFVDNDLVKLVLAECDRLPEPYAGTIKGVLGALLPIAVTFLGQKLMAASAASVAPAVAPVSIPAAAPQG